MPTSWHLNEKAERSVSKQGSPTASLAFIGLVTKYRTVKWRNTFRAKNVLRSFLRIPALLLILYENNTPAFH